LSLRPSTLHETAEETEIKAPSPSHSRSDTDTQSLNSLGIDYGCRALTSTRVSWYPPHERGEGLIREVPGSHGSTGVVQSGRHRLGCGRGLGVNLTAIPDPADPGQSVQWTVSVRNDTACTTTTTGLPPPLPGTGAFAIILGFIPGLDAFGPVEFCREFATTMTACTDEACLIAHVQEALGPQIANALQAQAQAAMQQPQPLLAGTCATVVNDSSGFAAVCAFDPLNPGEKGTATYMDTAPDTGSRNAAQVAVAFAPAEGADCRPGTEITTGEWELAGCFPTPAARGAPALSPVATALAALLLLMVGVVGLRHMRKS
jgi:hypothetical protein